MTEKKVANKFAGPCDRCGQVVAPMEGLAVGTPNGRVRVRGQYRWNYVWTVRHMPREWAGSPVSGGWVNGCPDPK